MQIQFRGKPYRKNRNKERKKKESKKEIKKIEKALDAQRICKIFW